MRQVHTFAEPIFAHVATRELDRDVLRFDAEAARARQSPRHHEEHTPDSAAEIEKARRVRARPHRFPRGREIIDGKAMAALPLHEPKRRRDGVAGELVRRHDAHPGPAWPSMAR